MTRPSLGAVVIGRNEGARLTRCLQSVALLRTVPSPIEVIYADSNSTDGSPARAAKSCSSSSEESETRCPKTVPCAGHRGSSIRIATPTRVIACDPPPWQPRRSSL